MECDFTSLYIYTLSFYCIHVHIDLVQRIGLLIRKWDVFKRF